MGAIKAARQNVATVLDAAATLSEFTVWADRQPITTPDSWHLIVVSRKVEPSPVAAFGRVIGLDVWLVSPFTTMGDPDDQLDDQLDDVLAVLDAARIEWTNAEPGIWESGFLSYRIEVET